MDRTYLNELDASEWQATLAEFKSELTDSVIYASIKTLPLK